MPLCRRKLAEISPHFRFWMRPASVLRAADVCTLRQVLQHLSDAEILAVLDNTSHIPYLVITEHLYVGPDSIPNKNIRHGAQTRCDQKSGVFLELPPFNRNAETLLELPYSEEQSCEQVWSNKSEGDRGSDWFCAVTSTDASIVAARSFRVKRLLQRNHWRRAVRCQGHPIVWNRLVFVECASASTHKTRTTLLFRRCTAFSHESCNPIGTT